MSSAKIAIFDYKVIRGNPVGSCHLTILESLCHQYDFTVYAAEFENPNPKRIRWVRLPVPTRPLALLFLGFHLAATLAYLWDRLRGVRYDLVQFAESNLIFGSVSYSHFCHRRYLRDHWGELHSRGFRSWIRRLNHWLHALAEPWVYQRVPYVVVPSQGLRRELETTYSSVLARGKIHVIPNPVDLERMLPSCDFERLDFRKKLGLQERDLVLVFVALGHFERKGLPLLLDALIHVEGTKLLVVGGLPDLVREWELRVATMGLREQVRFVGVQKDIRPYLWAADVFALPSSYEVFPLAALEAAAAGLPLLVTPLYGVEEFMRNGQHGVIIEPYTDSIVKGIRTLRSIPAQRRRQLGAQARAAVTQYTTIAFSLEWRRFYAKILG